MPKAKVEREKKAAPRATKAIKKEKAAPKKAASAKGKKDVLAAALPVPALFKTPSRASKKEMVAPKIAPSLSRSASRASKSSKVLDLCLLLDCTASMSSWIQRSKDTLKVIIDNVKADNPDLEVRVCFVGYRDIRVKPRFSIHEFTSDLD